MSAPVDAPTPGTESPLEEPLKEFEEGIEIGRALAEQAAKGLKEWAQRSPEQVLIVGVVAGFVLGKLLFPSRPRST
jgi:hypothetical protein